MLDRLFSSSTRVALLGHFLLHPERAYHVRELERIVGPGSYNSVWREVRNLAQLGLVTRKDVGRAAQHRLNEQSSLAGPLAELFRTTWAVADVLAPALEGAGETLVAFVYGSFASGEFGRTSDVDLLVVGDLDRDILDERLADAEARLGREVSYRLFSEDEWAARIGGQDPFAKEVMAGPKLLITGGADELEEVARQRGTQAT